ncbi:MAG: hypothetical protein AAGJ29_07065 [Pseudomonadota bacterium]
MFDHRDLEAAAADGVIDRDALGRLKAYLDRRGDPGAPADPENLRFLANFNDVFISIGIVLLALGLTAASGLTFAGTGSALIILAPVLAFFWILLEYFAGRRRLLLPSMTLALGVTLIAMILSASLGSGIDGNISEDVFRRGLTVARDFGLWASLGAFAAGAAIYARFRLPFALFLMAVAAAIGIYTLAATQGRWGEIFGGTLSFLVGIITLFLAIGFDAKDPTRKSLASDNAFWLHFAAAPQIMLGLRGILTGGGFQPAGPAEAGVMLAALAFFSALSLALNRRALVAAALLSFWLALGVLVESAGGSEISTATWTLILLGGGIVLLGGGWSTARRLILAVLPRHGYLARIFPPEPA